MGLHDYFEVSIWINHLLLEVEQLINRPKTIYTCASTYAQEVHWRIRYATKPITMSREWLHHSLDVLSVD